MLDGIELKGRCCVVCLGITTDGIKVPLGLWDGSTENKTVTKHLLADLVDRGLDVEQGVLVILDGSKALRRRSGRPRRPHADDAISATRSGTCSVACPNATGRRAATASRSLGVEDHQRALERLRVLADELDRSYPGAAASLREGLAETLTVTRLGHTRTAQATLATTNPIESMIEIVRRTRATSSVGSPATCACAGPPPACSRPRASSARSSATSTWPS